MEAIHYSGTGVVVLADDPDLEWPKRVLGNVQRFALEQGFYVQRMMPQLHQYHLDDAPELRSCNLLLRSMPDNSPRGASAPITDKARLANFYGRGTSARIRFVRERLRLDYGKAHQDEYSLEPLELSE